VYKNPKIHPRDATSVRFRERHAVKHDVRIRFAGVWDTVGALGVPVRMFGFLNEKHLFHDNKIGPNIDIARHALAIDERRDDFEPTIWKGRPGLDLQQVWFAGVHSDVGGGYKADRYGRLLSDIPLAWMTREATKAGLEFEPHLARSLKGDAKAHMNESYEGFMKVLGEKKRTIPRSTFIHESVKTRWEGLRSYRPEKLEKVVGKYGWDRVVG
jgi:uncharacterized protein (DUF2235 family)